MKIYINIAILITLFQTAAVFGQSNVSNLKKKLSQADSIILTSHQRIGGYISSNEDSNFRKPIVNGEINSVYKNEQIVLNKNSTQQLISLIAHPFRDEKIEELGTFEPTHTIYIFSKGVLSFIGIDFLAEEIMNSDDLIIPEKDFDKLTWKGLKLFFKQEGIDHSFKQNEH